MKFLNDLKKAIQGHKVYANLDNSQTPSTQDNEKIQIEIRKFTISTAINVAIIIVALAIAQYTSTYSKNRENMYNSIQLQVANARRSFIDLESQIEEIINIQKIWDIVQNKNIKRIGLDFDKARSIITELDKGEYLSSPISINVSNPDTKYDHPDSTITIESSVITLKLSSISDIYILKIIQSLVDNLPGYVSYNSFNLTKTRSLSPEIISDLKKGLLPAMVEGSIEILWQDLKDLDPSGNGEMK